MKQISHFAPRLRIGGFFLLGLSITSLGLSLAQVDWWMLQQRFSQQPSRLEAPYRYPYNNDSQPVRVNLTIAPQQEIDFYQERVRLDPRGGLNRAGLAAAYLRMAQASNEDGWYLLAEQNARRSLASLPFFNTEAVQVLARVAEAQHDFRESLRLAQQLGYSSGALSLQVTSNLAVGNLTAARQAADRLVERDPNPATLNLQALVSVAQGKDQQALQQFRSALEMEQSWERLSSVRTRLSLGRFYSQRGELERSQDLYLEALRIIPDYPLSLVYLGQLATRRKNFQAAESYFERAQQVLKDKQTSLKTVILVGQARLKNLQGDRSAAAKLWQQAETLLRASLSGTKFGHRRELALLLLERGHPQDQQEAERLMQAEVKLRQDAQTLDTLALALSRVGNWAGAQRAIDGALRSGVRDAVIVHRAGVIAAKLGDQTAANQYFQRARAIDPAFDPQIQDLTTLTAATGS